MIAVQSAFEEMDLMTSAPSTPQTDTGETSSGSLRSLLVTIGPALLLDAWCAFSTVRLLLRRRPMAAIGAAAPWVYVLCLRQWVLTWGATSDEVAARLPGDEIVVDPVWQSTRGIDIAAPADNVWPWLAQMGQDRGGLYSYDWLENLAGLEFHNADHIAPEWQQVQAGDFVRFAPNQDTLVVADVQPGAHLVWRLLKPGTRETGDVASGSVGVDATWAFVLRQIDTGHTRLIQRFRFGVRPRALGVLYPLLMEVPHFVMERAMLRGIRQRAEHLAVASSWKACSSSQEDANAIRLSTPG